MSQPNLADNFTANGGNWLVISYPGPANPRTPQWSAGQISYTPAAGETNYFFEAPATYTSYQAQAYGGKLSFSLGYGIATVTMGTSPVVVIQGGGTAIGIAMSPSQQLAGNCTFEVTIDETASWKILPANTAATATDIRNVLQQVDSILVQGNVINETFTTVSLSAVSLRYNSALALLISVATYYEGGELYASWEPSTDAYQYNIAVTNGSGTTVYTGQVPASGFVSPMQVGAGNWTPTAGQTYTVQVTACGPVSLPVSLTAVTIGQAVVSVQVGLAGVIFSWPSLPGATGYDISVFSVANGAAIWQTENIGSGPVTVTDVDGLTPGLTCKVLVRGRAGNAFGSWSASVTFAPLTISQQILTNLDNRLDANKTAGGVYYFDTVTLPAGPGNPDAVLSLIGANLPSSGVVITGTVTFPADRQSLTVSGTALLGAVPVTVNAVFGVSANAELTLIMRLALPDTWTFAETFPTLAYALPNYLYLTNHVLVFSSEAHQDSTVFYRFQAGLNYLGTLSYTSQLLPVIAGSAGVQQVIIGGPVIQDSSGVSLHFTGQSTVASLPVALQTLPPITLRNSEIMIKSQAVAGGLNMDSAVFSGWADLFGRTWPFNLDIPTKLGQSLSLSLVPGTRSSILQLGDALRGVAPMMIALVPDALNAIVNPEVTAIRFEFDPAQTEATTASLTLAVVSGSYELVPNTITIDDLQLSLIARYSRTSVTAPVISTQLQGGFTLGGLATTVTLFVPLSGDWVLTVEPTVPGSASLDNLATFTGSGKSSILNSLPAFFQPLTSFSLDKIVITAGVMPAAGRSSGLAFIPSVSSVGFTLAQGSAWHIVPNMLSLSGWTISLMMTNSFPGWEISGLLNGLATLGSGSGGPVFDISMPFPAGSNGWVISLDKQGFEIPGIGDLLTLAGAASVSNLLPDGFKSLGNVHVSAFSVRFDPTSSSPIKSVAFKMATVQDWTLISGQGLVISNVSAGITIFNNPAGAAPYALGYISGTFTIAGTSLWVRTSRVSPTAPWILKMATVTVIHVPGLSAIAAWMLPARVLTYIPVTMLPFANGLDIYQAGMQFNLTSGTLDQVSFVLADQETWSPVPGFITANSFLVNAVIDTPLATPALTLHGTLLLNIGSVGLKLIADKASPTAPWIFSAALASPVQIDFATALTDLSLKSTLPYSKGFPASMTLETVTATLNYTAGSFVFAATSSFDWSFNFGLATLNILSLGVQIAIEPALASGGRPYTFSAGGTFQLGSVQTVLNFVTGNMASTDTVLSAVITPAQMPNVSIAGTVNTLAIAPAGTTAPGSSQPWSDVIPTGYSTPAFSNAYLHINLTQEIFYLYGAASGLGSAALMVKKIGSGWGYAFGLDLGTGFRFANIFSSLAIIDNYLKVNSAGLFVVSYTGSTTSVVQDLGAINSFPDKPAGFKSVLPVSNLPALTMNEGMLFYAYLNITTGSLFNTLAQIGTPGTAQIVVYGIINKTDPTLTHFAADLPDIVLFSSLKFTRQPAYSGIHLTYSPGNNSQFQLAARLDISALFSTDYAFDGDLTVTGTALTARLTLVTSAANNAINNPFGIPGIVIENLFAQVNYTFGRSAIPASGTNPAVAATQTTSRFVVGGIIKLGPAPAPGATDTRLSCATTLALVGGNPALFSARLTGDFSIGAFFTQCINSPGFIWPTDLINIVFRTGSRVYYYNTANDPAGLYGTDGTFTYSEGFNIDANIQLTILVAVDIGFTLSVVRDTSGTSPAYKGVIATGTLSSSPINLFIIEIAGTTPGTNGKYTGSPAFVLDTTTPNATMGFTAGFNFLQKPFGTAGLRITRVTSASGTSEIQLSGMLSSAENFTTFGVLNLGFTYSSSAGLNITGWPGFDFISTAIDFIDTMKQLAQGGSGACGKLTGLINSIGFDTRFEVTPSWKTVGTDFYLVINGSYKLMVVDNAILEASFPNAVEVLLPNLASMDNLLGYVEAALTGAAKSFVNAIIDNPDQLATFLTIVGGSSATTYITDIVCNKMIKGTSTAAQGAAEAAAVAGVGAGVAALAGGALSTIAGGGLAGAAAIGTLVGIIAAKVSGSSSGGSSGSSGGSGGSSGGSSGSGSSSGSGGSATLPLVGTPQNLAFSFDNSLDEFTITWDSVTGNNGYEVRIFESANPVATGTTVLPAIGNTLVKVPLDSVTGKAPFAAEIRTIAGLAMQNSPYVVAANTILQISGTTLSTPVFNNNIITANWSTVAAAAGYILRLKSGSTDVKVETVAATGSIVVSQLAAGSYDMSVKVVGATTVISSGWSVAQPLNIQPLTIAQLAAKAKADQLTADQAGRLIMQAFPQTTPEQLAKALAAVSYNMADTGAALTQAYPALSTADRTSAMITAFSLYAFVNQYQGTYETAMKWGGATGVWNNTGTFTIVSNGDVILGSTPVKNPTFRNGNTLSWSLADGNSINAEIVFTIGSSAPYYWGNIPAPAQAFTGWSQYPGEGGLDYRGRKV